MEVPRLGIGIAYRAAIRRDILARLGEFGFIEVIAESFFRNEEALHALSTILPCVPHSLNLSVGSPALDDAYVGQVKRLADLVDAPWHSDHLAFTRTESRSLGHLAPVAYTKESLRVVEANVREVQRRVGRPFAVENITMPFYWPIDSMPEHEFISELVRRTGCGLLLDLENLRINAQNHGFDPRKALEQLPLERVFQVHLAGGEHRDGHHHDTHDAPVGEETWALLEHLCELAPPPAVLLERDANLEPFAPVLEEVRRARRILEAAA